MPTSPTRTSFVAFVARRLTGYNGNITPPGRWGRSSELVVKTSDYLKIGLINVGRRPEVRFVMKLLPCVIDDTKRVNIGKIVEGLGKILLWKMTAATNAAG